MSLIDLPQTKWGSGTGRQVILKGDFAKIEQAVTEAFEFTRGPGLEYVDSATLRVKATADCKARVMMCGFPSPLARGHWVHGGLSDGRYRENAAPVSLNLATAGQLWGTEKPDQWYAVYALAGANDAIFSLKAMPVIRVASQDSQVVTLRNNANGANIDFRIIAVMGIVYLALGGYVAVKLWNVEFIGWLALFYISLAGIALPAVSAYSRGIASGTIPIMAVSLVTLAVLWAIRDLYRVKKLRDIFRPPR